MIFKRAYLVILLSIIFASLSSDKGCVNAIRLAKAWYYPDGSEEEVAPLVAPALWEQADVPAYDGYDAPYNEGFETWMHREMNSPVFSTRMQELTSYDDEYVQIDGVATKYK